eukprot:CAMPEP_0179304110 /NCGR_PEP_ID=MMETSP0797-20121207/48927_1 /TAXON_ID=47934 /ORGANISM="Dinophysis acuminata, Strain DAEP01" /LENGTH=52 /DNA_ID=CAMNT_0021013693 /DNA_START=84 /DNA_END=238 /DNA_ORIENTATION=+
MPSGPSLNVDNQWEPVVWTKAGPAGKSAKSTAEVNAARRTGAEVQTDRRMHS